MQDLSKITINPKATIKECLEKLGLYDELRILLVNDMQGKFIGIITDPDIRRGLIHGMKLEDCIETIIQNNPIMAHINTPQEKIFELSAKHNIYQIPLVDDAGKIIKIYKILQSLTSYHQNYVVIMGGGLGTRLAPLTNTIPKPMLKVGNKPILEIILNKIRQQGFRNIILSVNYKSHIIENYFKNGEDFGLNISYIKETKRLGTAGALSLINGTINESFFVMNGDILCNLDFRNMLQFHHNAKSLATMGVRKYYHQIPYGVIQQQDSKITSIIEKPNQEFLLNAGIYCLQPETLNFIPKNEFFDMPSLFEIICKQKLAFTYLIEDYWIDIGRHEELARANLEIDKLNNE